MTHYTRTGGVNIWHSDTCRCIDCAGETRGLAYYCRDGHMHTGARARFDGAKCPEQEVADMIGKGWTLDAASEHVYEKLGW